MLKIQNLFCHTSAEIMKNCSPSLSCELSCHQLCQKLEKNTHKKSLALIISFAYYVFSFLRGIAIEHVSNFQSNFRFQKKQRKGIIKVWVSLL